MHKKKILFVPFDLLAHYLRCLELAKSIRNEAVEIVFLQSVRYNDFIRNHGFRYTDGVCEGYSQVVMKAGKFDFSWINEKSTQKTVCSLMEVLEDKNPDLVIGDTYPGLNIACNYLKIEHIALINAYVTNHYTGFRDTPHSHPANLFRRYVSQEKWTKIVMLAEDMMLRKVHSPYRKIRENLGLEPKVNLFDEFTGDTNFIVDDKQLFPTEGLPDNFIQEGPILFTCTQAEERVHEFLHQHRSKPTIYVSTGSSGKNIVPETIHDSRLTGFNLIISGSERESETENAIFRRFVNFDDIADKVDLVLCHGGNGTLYQALNAGKRIIAVPYIFEQEWNVQRFTTLNLCKVFYHDEKPEKLIRLIRQTLAEPPGTTCKDAFCAVPDIYKEFIFKSRVSDKNVLLIAD
ncbi:MAG TPA: glycosyltransferase [Bacteroidales bacterium]|nr:glycosyltransferase [Bacteroidales bacterium]HRZ49667.1 glycosyltransferase [Bacteroidales bacterium]